jgi:hypothetical protein
VIGLYARAGIDLQHWHPGCLGEKTGELAWLFWVKMLNQHEGHAGIDRQVFEKSRKGIEASSRRADADNGNLSLG